MAGPVCFSWLLAARLARRRHFTQQRGSIACLNPEARGRRALMELNRNTYEMTPEMKAKRARVPGLLEYHRVQQAAWTRVTRNGGPCYCPKRKLPRRLITRLSSFDVG
jgi:hypothetical protein